MDDSALGKLGNITQQAKKTLTRQVSQTVETSVEQVGGGKRLSSEDLAKQANLKQQQDQNNKDFLAGLYGSSTDEEKKKQSVGTLEQLGFGNKKENTGSLGEQLGFGKKDQTTGSVGEQLGFTPSKDTASLKEQLAVSGTSVKTPQEQKELQQKQHELHKQEYYDPLVTRAKPQTEVEVEEQQEKRENAADRMKRLEMEDQKKDREKKKKMQNPALEQAQSPEKRHGTIG
ncbi:MAG: hypothetical protein HYT10_00250 [Candidatus Levybacteria bacterium]|nr:hypothetical protein [Candidatus Levybacteria bacterium]